MQSKLFVVVVLFGCGPRVGTDARDADGTGGDTGNVGVDGDEEGIDGCAFAGTGGIECPPPFGYFEMGCTDDWVEYLHRGCHEPCDGEAASCSLGSCARVVVDPTPCREFDLDPECGVETWLCSVGPAPQSGFWDELVVHGGCGNAAPFVFARNEDGSVAMRLQFHESLLDEARASMLRVDATYVLPDPEVEITIHTGPGVGADLCSESPSAPVLREYEAIGGIVDVAVEPPTTAGGPVRVTATLQGIDFEQVSLAGGIAGFDTFDYQIDDVTID